MTDHLYRVRITEYPNGSVEPVHYPGDDEPQWVPVSGWAPPGWKPEGNYIKMLGTSKFVWPSTKKLYRSRSTANKRANLLRSFGATVVIERSNKIVWPDTMPSHEKSLSDPVSPPVAPCEDDGLLPGWEAPAELDPIIDAARTYPDRVFGRDVLADFGVVNPYAYDLLRWCKVPIRLEWSEIGGLELEFGPYTLCHRDIKLLRTAISAYDFMYYDSVERHVPADGHLLGT
jgi:hypothetical protein